MKYINRLFKLFYWPICRAYARHIINDKPADSIYRFLCGLQFIKTHHFWPNFIKPQRFSEKIWSRMLNNRNPQLTLLNDKLHVRDFVASRVGSDYLIPILWKGGNPENIPFEDLPPKFVIKATHGCDYNILVKNKELIDKKKIRLQLAKWLKTNYCQSFLIGVEWGYKNIKPYIIIESFIGDTEKAPTDYKFYCFSGRVEFVTVHFDRFIEHKTRSFNRDFNPYDFTYHFNQWDGECLRPQNFNTMINLAEALSDGIDFIRVDLYNVSGRIYFGELTPYPGGVSTRFLPASRDYALGEKWK